MPSIEQGATVSSTGFSIVPYALMDQFSDPKVLAVYLWLHRHGFGSSQGCWASVETISKESGVGINNVRKILQDLARLGWIVKREKPGSTTTYFVRTDPPIPHETVTPHEIVRAPLTKSLGEQEPLNKKTPLNPPKGGERPYHSEFQRVWNEHAPQHWPRIRSMDDKRVRKANGLSRQFGSDAKALEALQISLDHARNEAWCMKPEAKLTLENWLSNNKVAQRYEMALEEASDRGLTHRASHDVIEALEAARERSDLFAKAEIDPEGRLHLFFADWVLKNTTYPASTKVLSRAALQADIDYLSDLKDSLSDRGSSPLLTPWA